MLTQTRIGPVQYRLIAIRTRHAGAQIIGDQQPSNAPECLERVNMSIDP